MTSQSEFSQFHVLGIISHFQGIMIPFWHSSDSCRKRGSFEWKAHLCGFSWVCNVIFRDHMLFRLFSRNSGGSMSRLFSSSLILGTCQVGHLDSHILDFLNEVLCVFCRTLQLYVFIVHNKKNIAARFINRFPKYAKLIYRLKSIQGSSIGSQLNGASLLAEYPIVRNNKSINA